MFFVLDGVASPIPGIPFEMVLVLGIFAACIAAVSAVLLIIFKLLKKRKGKKEGEEK